MSPPLKYLIVYPFTPLTVAKCFNVVITILMEFGMSTREPPLLDNQNAMTASICDLVALFVTVVSLWFTVQKFFLKKVDISLSVCASVLYSISGICILLIPSRPEDTIPDKISILLMHVYLIMSALFSSTWAYMHSTDVVSTLLIAHWGASTTDEEIESLLLQF